MDSIGVSELAMSAVVATFAGIQLAWYIGVAIGLYKIWQKVRHLPG